MMKATQARYTLEFKEEAVRLVKGGERQATVAKNLGLSEQTLHNNRNPVRLAQGRTAARHAVRNPSSRHGRGCRPVCFL
jgi:transposase-like protein